MNEREQLIAEQVEKILRKAKHRDNTELGSYQDFLREEIAAALRQQGEPVAWVADERLADDRKRLLIVVDWRADLAVGDPLFTSPPQQQGEYICTKCGLRQKDTHPKGDF